MLKTGSLGAMLVVLTMVFAGSGVAQTRAKVMLEGGRIVPVVGKVIEKGNILIENGRIVAIGADVKAPFDAKVIDVGGKTLFPGLVDAWNASGLDVSNENLDVAPFTTVRDSIDPASRYFEEALRSGITSIHASQGARCVISGLSRVVHPIGMTVDEMTQRATGGLVISIYPKSGYDHAVQHAVLRDAFIELDRYLDRLGEKLYEKDLEEKDETLRVGPDEARKRGRKLIRESDVDMKFRNLWRLREGKVHAFVWAARAMDVAPAFEIAKEQGFDEHMTLMTGPEAWKAHKALKKLTLPVILPASSMVYREKDRITLEETDTFVPKVYADKKIPFAISGSSEPWYDAARCVREGVSKKTAIEAITINAARAIGMDHMIGSLEVGKIANILVLTGEPLDMMTWVDQVFVGGVRVYERSKDKRMRELMLGIAETELDRENKKPAAEESGETKKPAAEKSGEAKKDAPAGKPAETEKN